MMRWKQQSSGKKALAAAMGGILLLVVLSVADQAWLSPKQPAVVSSVAGGNTGEPVPQVIIETKEQESPNDAVSLTDQEKQMLDVVLEQMEIGDYTAVGILLNEQTDAYQDLFYQSMGGVRLLYDGKTVSDKIEGRGMVLDKGNTVFYGDFSGGAPNGECLAIQAVSLDFPRYDFAKGTWKDGMLHGFGQIGYDYYQGNELEEAQNVIKEGEFKENLMDGDIAYTSSSIGGFSATWHMTVKEGVIQLDDRWIADSTDGTFSLVAEGDETHAYVISPFDLERVFWQNLILW